MKLNDAQQNFLLSPLSPSRVSSRTVQGRSLSYVEASDIKRYLIRVFGIGGFSTEVVSCDLAFEQERPRSSGNGMNWNVGYKVGLRLTVHDAAWAEATYLEYAVGFASLPDRGEAHDMAVKTAESDALKRAAIYLGTQFGLSLYFNGTRDDVVGATLAGSVAPEAAAVADPVHTATPEVPEAAEDATAAPEAEAVAGQSLTDETEAALTTLTEAGMNPTPPVTRSDATYTTWMDSLKAAAVNPDNARRVQVVSALQATAARLFEEGFLDSLVTVAGATMTHRSLCANVAAGQYLEKP